MSGLLYRFTDATEGKIFAPVFWEETLQRSHIFACMAKSEALNLLRVSHKFSCTVLRAFTKEF
jgi:hypothetical protein